MLVAISVTYLLRQEYYVCSQSMAMNSWILSTLLSLRHCCQQLQSRHWHSMEVHYYAFVTQRQCQTHQYQLDYAQLAVVSAVMMNCYLL